jgi:hypothetical protein
LHSGLMSHHNSNANIKIRIAPELLYPAQTLTAVCVLQVFSGKVPALYLQFQGKLKHWKQICHRLTAFRNIYPITRVGVPTFLQCFNSLIWKRLSDCTIWLIWSYEHVWSFLSFVWDLVFLRPVCIVAMEYGHCETELVFQNFMEGGSKKSKPI